MLEQRIKLISESLARTLDRRMFLRGAGSAVVSGMSALMLGPSLSTVPTPDLPPGPAPRTPICNPPGPFCNLDGNFEDPNGCHGGHCFQHLNFGVVRTCRVFYQFYP